MTTTMLRKRKTKKWDARPIMTDPVCIRSCEEISPEWFDDWTQIPLEQMFADDSLWLTMLLTSAEKGEHLKFDGWFHFNSGGAEVKSVMHYHIAVRQDVNDSLLIEEKEEEIPKAEKSKNDKTYKLEVTTQPKFTLEKQLFHELHTHDIHSITIKEFKEC